MLNLSESNKARRATSWELPEASEVQGFEGKKLVHEKFKMIQDPMSEY
jgi:hypothetical protein